MDDEIALPPTPSSPWTTHAIAEALRKRSKSRRYFSSKRLQRRSSCSSNEPEGDIGLPSGAYRCALLAIALTIAVASVAFETPHSQPLETVQNSTSQLEDSDQQVQSTLKKHKPKSNDQFDDQDEASETRNKPRPRMILEYESRDLDFQMEMLGVKKDELVYPCPLDALFHEGCEKRHVGEVCIYPHAVLKRVKEDALDNELAALERLTDTRFFPKLYYANELCRTVLQENVRPVGKKRNAWCSNYTVYETFYKSAFRIFNQQNIIPVDLNLCCNTIVNDDHIRIIDFEQYIFDEPAEKVHETNREMLERILEDVKKHIKKYADRCLR